MTLLALLQGLSFITFICYVVSSASAFLTVPLLEFLLAVYFLFADAMQLNDKWQGLCWPMMVRMGWGSRGKGWLSPEEYGIPRFCPSVSNSGRQFESFR